MRCERCMVEGDVLCKKSLSMSDNCMGKSSCDVLLLKATDGGEITSLQTFFLFLDTTSFLVFYGLWQVFCGKCCVILKCLSLLLTRKVLFKTVHITSADEHSSKMMHNARQKRTSNTQGKITISTQLQVQMKWSTKGFVSTV